MIARLGNVLYWLGCAGAVVGFGLALLVFISRGGDPPVDAWTWILTYAVAGVGMWLVGRAARYILSGK